MKNKLIVFNFLLLTIYSVTLAMEPKKKINFNHRFYIKHSGDAIFNQLEKKGNLKKQPLSFTDTEKISCDKASSVTFNCIETNDQFLYFPNTHRMIKIAPLNTHQREGLRPYVEHPEYAKTFELYYFLNKKELILINATKLPEQTHVLARSSSTNSYFFDDTDMDYYEDNPDSSPENSDSDSYSRGRSRDRYIRRPVVYEKQSVPISPLPTIGTLPTNNINKTNASQPISLIGKISILAIFATCLLYSDEIIKFFHY